MDIAMIGLGKIGANKVQRLVNDDHRVVALDFSEEVIRAAEKAGASEAVDLDVPAPVITLSLQARFISRQEESFAAKMLAAMRNQFGGYAVKKAE